MTIKWKTIPEKDGLTYYIWDSVYPLLLLSTTNKDEFNAILKDFKAALDKQLDLKFALALLSSDSEKHKEQMKKQIEMWKKAAAKAKPLKFDNTPKL